MGLDMYVYTAPVGLVGDQQVDITGLCDANRNILPEVNRNFAYWRKFDNLHWWMKTLYRSKGGTDLEFNLNTVRLMSEDLDKLAQDVSRLTPQAWFFWGDQEDMDAESIKKVSDFIDRARTAIAEGKAVIYNSWW